MKVLYCDIDNGLCQNDCILSLVGIQLQKFTKYERRFLHDQEDIPLLSVVLLFAVLSTLVPVIPSSAASVDVSIIKLRNDFEALQYEQLYRHAGYGCG
jgi:hypothetical protein